MKISVPKETKQGERRVALLPQGVKELVAAGHLVNIETGAGTGIGIGDQQYQAAGAKISQTAEEVWTDCDLLVKVKEPSPSEYNFFRPGLKIFCFFHLVALPQLAEKLIATQVTAIDYDLLQNDSGDYPILKPMSEIAGALAPLCGAQQLMTAHGGKGLLLAEVVSELKPKVLVLGIGNAGWWAIKQSLGLGAEVTALDINERKLELARKNFPKLAAKFSTPKQISSELERVDLIIGSALVPGARSPILITEEHLCITPNDSVLVDISIDQGGIAASSRATSIAEPTYKQGNLIHYCVPNMPSLVALTATTALTSASLNYIKKIASSDDPTSEPTLKSSVIAHQGRYHQ